MRTVQFAQVFRKVARWHGINSSKEVPPDTRDAIVERINDRVLEICGVWPWPEWNVTEQRAYRQVWNATHQYLISTPDEVFYNQTSTYHRVREDAPGDPPVGTLPTDTVYWEDITSGIGTYIAYDQVCRRSIGTVLGVYGQNPGGCGCNGSGRLKFHVSHNGVEICHPSAATVFVSYQMPVPKYSMVPYAEGKTYAKADIVFDPVTGECFQALVATSNPPTTTDWGRIPFLEKWEKYVTNGSFADGMCESDQEKNVDMAQRQIMIAMAEQKASDALQREVDTLTQQGQALQWATCRRGEYWCESQPWGGGEVSVISDVCEAGWVFGELPPQIIAPGAFRCPELGECPQLAYLPLPNVFGDVQTIPGVRLETKEINSNYTLTVTDFEILADASAGPITVYLPMALGSGQFYHVSKRDMSSNTVTVVPQSGDLLDGQSSIALATQYADVAMTDAALGVWDKFGLGIGASIDVSDFARLSFPNTFTQLNTLTGVRFATKTVTDDYELNENDFTVLVNAVSGPITITLPPSVGNGQIYHIKKIDDTDEIVTVQAQSGDHIDIATSVIYWFQFSGSLLQDAAPGYWDNIGAIIEEEAIELPEVLWHPEINDNAELAAFTTLGLILLSKIEVLYSSGERHYMLVTGAAVGGDPGQVEPNDYDVSTNNVHWLQTL